MVKTKILAMILAVAMVVAVVPAFTLTASAEVAAPPEGAVIDQFKLAATTNFTAPEGPFNDKPVKEAFGQAWDRDLGDKGKAGCVNVQTFDKFGTVLRFVENQGRTDKGAGTAFTCAATTTDKLGNGKEYTMLSFTNWYPNEEYKGNQYMNFSLKDADGNVFAYFKLDKNYPNVSGKEYPAEGVAGDTPSEMFPIGLPKYGDKVDIVWYNNETGYTVDFYVNGVKTASKTYAADAQVTENETDKAPASVNGFSAICANIPEWNDTNATWGFANMSIASGDFADFDKVASVKVTYKAGEKTFEETHYYNKENTPDGVTIPAKYYAVDGTSELYKADAVTLNEDSENTEIEMKLLKNPDVNNFAKDTVVPVGDKHYRVLSDNLIPNGNFSEGLNGWFDGTNSGENAVTLSEYRFDIQEDGTIKALMGQGNLTAGAVYRTWAIAPGKTYAFTLTDSAENEYHILSLSNTLGDEAEGDTAIFGTKPANNATAAADKVKTGQNVYVFTNEGDYTYAKIRFRWNSGNIFGKFGLYEVEYVEPDANVNVVYADGDEIVSEPLQRFEGRYSGDTFTPDKPEVKYYTSETTGYLYALDEAAPQAIKLEKGENNAIIPVTKIAKLVKQENGNYNLVENGDFSNDKDGWELPEKATVTENGELLLSTDETTYDGRLVSGLGRADSLQQTVNVKTGKTYFYSADYNLKGKSSFLNFSFADTALVVNNDAQDITGTAYVEDGCQSDIDLERHKEVKEGDLKFSKDNVNKWHTYQGVAKAPEGARVFEFDAYYLCDAQNSLADNFKVYELAEVTEIPDSEMTVIAGNDPVLPKYVEAKLSDGTTDLVAVTWDKQADDTDFDAATTTPIELTGTPVDAAHISKTAKLSVNVVADDYVKDTEMPQTKWGEIPSVNAENASTSAHRFYTPVKGTVDFEFDVTFKDLKGLSVNAGNFGIFLGDSNANKNLPSYSREGNAIGIQGASENNEFGFRNGEGWADKTFKVVTDKPYRVFITAYTDDVLGVAEEEDAEAPVLHKADTYDATVYDADGVTVFSATGLAFRKAVDKIDTLVVATNTSGKDGDIVVSNFRVSWLDGFKTYYVNAECDNACGVEPWELVDTSQLPDDDKITAKVIDSDAEAIAPLPAVDHTYLRKEVRDWETYTGQDPDAATAQQGGSEFLVMIYRHDFGAEEMFDFDIANPDTPQNEVTDSSVGQNGYLLQPLTWGNKPVLVMNFNNQIDELIFKNGGKKFSTAELHLTAAWLNNAGDKTATTFTAYAIPKDKADFGLSKLYGKGEGESITDKNWIDQTGAVELGSYKQDLTGLKKGSTDTNVKFSIKLDFSKVDVTSGDDLVIALVAGGHSARIAGKAYEQGIYAPAITLIETADIVATPAPKAVEPVLGWHDGKFTIDLKLAEDEENATAVEVMPDAAETAISANLDGADVVAFSAANTNRIYTVYAKNGDVDGPTVKTSIYALVVKAVADLAANGGKIAENQIEAVNTVLNNGGLFVTEDGKLTPEADMVMGIEGDVVTLDKAVVDAGLAFKADIKTDGKYDTVKLNEDGTVTLTDSATGASVDGVMLEEIEFVFEPDEVTDSADYSGEIDFVEVI